MTVHETSPDPRDAVRSGDVSRQVENTRTSVPGPAHVRAVRGTVGDGERVTGGRASGDGSTRDAAGVKRSHP